MKRSPKEIEADAWVMKRSSFPQNEKQRHYKELLVYLRGTYRISGIGENDDDEAIRVYALIKDMLDRK